MAAAGFLLPVLVLRRWREIIVASMLTAGAAGAVALVADVVAPYILQLR